MRTMHIHHFHLFSSLGIYQQLFPDMICDTAARKKKHPRRSEGKPAAL